eukprot:12377743-Alexandrium_andersonii.AAC.1
MGNARGRLRAPQASGTMSSSRGPPLSKNLLSGGVSTGEGHVKRSEPAASFRRPTRYQRGRDWATPWSFELMTFPESE